MNTPNTAPKDTNFLGHFGWPWLCMTRWNEATAAQSAEAFLKTLNLWKP
jgi:hypothetical protein